MTIQEYLGKRIAHLTQRRKDARDSESTTEAVNRLRLRAEELKLILYGIATGEIEV